MEEKAIHRHKDQQKGLCGEHDDVQVLRDVQMECPASSSILGSGAQERDVGWRFQSVMSSGSLP